MESIALQPTLQGLVADPTANGAVDAVPSNEGGEKRCGQIPERLDAVGGVQEETAQRTRIAMRDHFDLVWRTLRRLGVAMSELEDAAEHVFLTFMARACEVHAGRERSFLVATAVRVAANARRRANRAPELLGEVEPADHDGLTPEQLLDWKQRRQRLDRALGTLNHEQRTVFVLYELEGFSLAEIAAVLSVPLGTANSRLMRARAGLEAWLKKHRSEIAR